MGLRYWISSYSGWLKVGTWINVISSVYRCSLQKCWSSWVFCPFFFFFPSSLKSQACHWNFSRNWHIFLVWSYNIFHPQLFWPPLEQIPSFIYIFYKWNKRSLGLLLRNLFYTKILMVGWQVMIYKYVTRIGYILITDLHSSV